MNVPTTKELRKWCVSVSEAALILMDATVLRSTGMLFARDITRLMKRSMTDADLFGSNHAIEIVVVSFYSYLKTRVDLGTLFFRIPISGVREREFLFWA